MSSAEHKLSAVSPDCRPTRRIDAQLTREAADQLLLNMLAPMVTAGLVTLEGAGGKLEG